MALLDDDGSVATTVPTDECAYSAAIRGGEAQSTSGYRCTVDSRHDLTRAYDANADEREARGEPAWRDEVRADFATRLSPGSRLLDVGAGVGYSSRWFADRGFDVVGTDLSPANVAKIREKGVAGEVADMKDLPFDDETFDAAWAASCLMHIADAELPDVLREIRRVLRRGALFWSGTWGGEDTEGIWQDDFYRPKRFYSLRSDARIQAFYDDCFDVLSFRSWKPNLDRATDWSYQEALLRAR